MKEFNVEKYKKIKQKIDNQLQIYSVSDLEEEMLLQNSWMLIYDIVSLNGEEIKEKYISLMKNVMALVAKYFENSDEIEKSIPDELPSPFKIISKTKPLTCSECRVVAMFESLDHAISKEAENILFLKFQISMLKEKQVKDRETGERLVKEKLAVTFGGLLLLGSLFGIEVEELS